MRRALRYFVVFGIVLVIAGAITITWYVRTLGPRIQLRVVNALEDRFDADVTITGLHVILWPRPKIVGENLVLRHKGWDDPKPILSIKRFSADTDLKTVISRNNHVNEVRLEGLSICIPPRGRSALINNNQDNHEVASDQPGADQTRLQFSIDSIVARDTLLEIEPKAEGKEPLDFELHDLVLSSIGPGQAMRFRTKMANAKPPGLIDSEGTFGPWQKDDPRATSVAGRYTFQNADLSVFKGISGTLASSGEYKGVLQHINVSGTTDVPNFNLKRGGNPVHLATTFQSIVNGADGDTILEEVDANFLHSQFLCKGEIAKRPREHRKTLALDASTTQARMEDILALVMNGPPVVTGNVDFHSKIVIPPGPQDVIDKLQLAGQFNLSSAQFTSKKVQERLLTLSDRARGIDKQEEAEGQGPEAVASDLRGTYSLANSVANFSNLSFRVPGALITLHGSYNLESNQIAFNGLFRMQATLSQTQSGYKHWVLLPFDKFFKKNGAGFQAPLSISGTREQPAIGIRVFRHQFTIH